MPDRGERLALLAVFALALAAGANSIQNGFIYDDTVLILENPYIRDLRHLPDILMKDMWGFLGATDVTRYYRPVVMLLYTVDYQLFGLDPRGYHLVNVLINALASVVVGMIFITLSRRKYGEGRAVYAALLAGALFAVHPAHAEAVAWAGGEPVFGLLFLGALLAYIRGRFYSSLALFSISLFAKETAVMLLPLILVHDAALGHPFEARRARDMALRYAHYPLLVAAYLALRFAAIGGMGSFAPRHTELTPWQAVLNVPPLFAAYARMLLLPVNQSVYHVFHPVLGIGEPRALPAIVAVCLGLAGAAALWKKSRTGFFAAAMAVVPLLPAFYLPALGENSFAERYLYVPSAGFAVLAALGAAAIGGRTVRALSVMSSLMLAAFFVLAIALFVLTVNRNAVFRDDLSLWSDAARKHPGNHVIQSELAYSYERMGMPEEAERRYRASLELNPQHTIAHNNLGLLLLASGRYDEAVRHFQYAIALRPEAANLYENLARAYRLKGWEAQAREQEDAARRLMRAGGDN